MTKRPRGRPKTEPLVVDGRTYLPLRDAAATLGKHPTTLERALRRTPPLPARKHGGAWVVAVDEARAYLDRNALGRGKGRPPKVDVLLRDEPGSTPPPAGDAPAGPQGPPGALPALSDEDRRLLGEVFGGDLGALEVRPDAVRRLVAIAEAKKANADAEKRVLEVQARRGELVSRAEVERGRVQRILIVRQGLLALPGKLAARCAGRTQEEVHEEIAAEVDSLLRQFSEEFAPL